MFDEDEFEVYAEGVLQERWGAAHSMARKRVNDPNLIEDAAQEALIEMWRQLKRGQRGASTARGVLNVAGYRKIGQVASGGSGWFGQPKRPQGVRVDDYPRPVSIEVMAEDEDGWPEREPDAGVRVDQDVLDGMQWERVKNRIHQLPEDLKRIAVLLLEGKSHREIADEMGLTRSQMRLRVQKVRESLKDLREDVAQTA